MFWIFKSILENFSIAFIELQSRNIIQLTIWFFISTSETIALHKQFFLKYIESLIIELNTSNLTNPYLPSFFFKL